MPDKKTHDASGSSAAPPSFWRSHRQEIVFLTLFVAILGGGFLLIAWNPVNDHVIEPFTAAVARTSGWVLDLIGQDVTMQGTVIRNPRFAVNIKNGCNGVETMIIFAAAVLAFPTGWRQRFAGLALGGVAIQLVNLVRVVALFLTGVYFHDLFDASHTTVWQTIVILFGVLLWILWANRFATPAAAAKARPEAAGEG
jgi:exosortase H (IPTLxxWG-CTERM-specific)